MRTFTYLTAALALAPGALAIDQRKSVLIWFENPQVPDTVIQDAKDAVISAGGKVTHTYNLIKGFAAIAPENTLKTMKASWEDKHKMKVEEDEIFSTD